MTDQEIVAGRGENAEASGTLGLNFYGLSSDGNVQTLFSSADMGQGSGAVAWLTGNFVGASIDFDQVAQLWDNGGNLGLNIYAPFIEKALISFPDLGQGSGAVAWLAGNFFGGSTDAIAQLWDNGGTLGLNVYQMAGGSAADGDRLFRPGSGIGCGGLADRRLHRFGPHGDRAALGQRRRPGAERLRDGRRHRADGVRSSDLGQGSGALAWLTGDFSDVGTTEGSRTSIAQLWDNDGTLGAVVYGVVNGTAETLFGSSDLGQGSGAVAWLTGHFSSSDYLDIAQLWDNDGTLSVFFYADGNRNGNLGTDPFHGGNLGQGPGALAWLTGDFTASGLTAIAQPWAS